MSILSDADADSEAARRGTKLKAVPKLSDFYKDDTPAENRVYVLVTYGYKSDGTCVEVS